MKKFSWITSIITKCPFNPLAPINIKSIRLSFSFAEIVINKYGIRLSHVFEIPSISNEKPNVLIKISSISIKDLEFQMRNSEISGFSNLEFHKTCEIPGFLWTLCISSSIGFRSYLRIRRLLGKYYTPAQLDQQQKSLFENSMSVSDGQRLLWTAV